MKGVNRHPIYLLWFQTKPEEFGFQLKVGNQLFHYFTIGSITRTSVNSGLKLNPGLKPNLKHDQINWVKMVLAQNIRAWIVLLEIPSKSVKIQNNLLEEGYVIGHFRPSRQYISGLSMCYLEVCTKTCNSVWWIIEYGVLICDL